MLGCLTTLSPLAHAAQPPPWPLALRAQILRLAEVDWRMRLAAAPRCPARTSGIGVTVDHAAAYPGSARALLARELRLRDLPQVASVATDSPAWRTGIRPGDEIASIGAIDMAAALAQSPDPSLSAEDAMDRLAALPAGEPAVLLLRRGRAQLRKTVVPVETCAGRTTLATGDALDAYSDSSDVAVTSALVDFTANDDELALIVGHEIAHIMLHGADGQPDSNPLAVEVEADLLGAAIAHCAGYDLRRAVAFWPRFDAQDALRRERLGTHPSPGQREKRILAATGAIACPIATTP